MSTLFNLCHRLWTKAVGTPEYDKSEWKQLEAVILRLDAVNAVNTIAVRSLRELASMQPRNAWTEHARVALDEIEKLINTRKLTASATVADGTE